MLQTASLTRGTFIQRAANLFRAAWAPCVKKYVWKIPGESESFNFTFTSTKYLSRYYVGRLQTNVSLLAKQHPPEDYTEIPQSFFFSSSTHIVHGRGNTLGHCRRRCCCGKKELSPTKRWTAPASLSSEGKPTLIPRLCFWINDHHLHMRKKCVMESD